MSIIPNNFKKQVSKKYFTNETEQAIVQFNHTEDLLERSKIYKDKIHFAFFKLTENIIHTYKFYYTDEDEIENKQHEVITFLLNKLHLYHHSKNIQDKLKKIIIKEFKEEYTGDFIEYTHNSPIVTQEQINSFLADLKVSKKCLTKLKIITPPKAFSYFGTIAKNYLIIENQKNYKKKKDSVTLDSIEQDEKHSYTIGESNTSTQLSFYIDTYTDYCTKNIYKLFPEKTDAKVADAILELFRKREHLDILNKKVLYIYIREQIDVKTPKITSIAEKLYSIFKKGYLFYLENGYINL